MRRKEEDWWWRQERLWCLLFVCPTCCYLPVVKLYCWWRVKQDGDEILRSKRKVFLTVQWEKHGKHNFDGSLISINNKNSNWSPILGFFSKVKILKWRVLRSVTSHFQTDFHALKWKRTSRSESCFFQIIYPLRLIDTESLIVNTPGNMENITLSKFMPLSMIFDLIVYSYPFN